MVTFLPREVDSMAISKDLRQPIQGFPPISEAEAEELAQRAQEAVRARYEGALEPREGEKGDTIGALLVMTEFVEYRTAAMARQTVHAAEAFFHEQEVITPAEEAFAAKHGVTVEDLETAWGKRREGIRGKLFKEETERRAALRDAFFELIDAVGTERMGEGYTYDQFIAGVTPDVLLEVVQARLDAA